MSAYNRTTLRSPAPQSMCTRASPAGSRTAPQPLSQPAHKKQKPFWRRNFDRKKSDPPNSDSAVADVSTPSGSPRCDLEPGALGEAIVDTNATEELPEYPRGSNPPQIKVEYKDMGSYSPDDAYVTDDENSLRVMYNDRSFREALGERRQDRFQDFRRRRKEWLADREEKESNWLAKLLKMNARMTDTLIV